jgi:16S rRNA (uracil1498-N3)-methyltransferase
VHRFFAPSLDPGDEAVTLPRDEGEHLTRVLRLGVGDTVSVFDGRGHEYLARVMSARRRDVRVQIVSRVDPTAESAVHLTLVQSTLKGERMDEVIRDAVMLGVAAVQPVIAKRSEVTVAALLRGGRVDRWRRVALASAKQSRRAVLPEVRTPLALDTYLLEPRPALTLMMVEPTSGTEVESVRALRREPPPSEAALLVGPEGGWDPAETQAARSHGVRLMSLGPRTLRADAVPVAAISVLQFLWEDLP